MARPDEWGSLHDDRVGMISPTGESKFASRGSREWAMGMSRFIAGADRHPVALLPECLCHGCRRGSFTHGFVRKLLRYCASAPLPAPLAHGCTPWRLSMRSAALASQRMAEGRGISRFPSKLFARVLRVSDRAESHACFLNASARARDVGFRHSIPGPRVPSSPLARPHRANLSFTTSCRF